MTCRSIHMIFALSLFVACDDDRNPAPPIASATDVSSSSGGSSSGSSDDASSTGISCAAFSGCVEACEEEECFALCASAAAVDQQTCVDVYCEGLRETCASGLTSSCEALLRCADDLDTSGSGSSG